MTALATQLSHSFSLSLHLSDAPYAISLSNKHALIVKKEKREKERFFVSLCLGKDVSLFDSVNRCPATSRGNEFKKTVQGIVKSWKDSREGLGKRGPDFPCSRVMGHQGKKRGR